MLNSNLSIKNGYADYASNISLENLIESNKLNMNQFVEYTFHVDNITGTPFESNNNVIVKVIITDDNKTSYNVEVMDTLSSKTYYITKVNNVYGAWTSSLVDIDSNLSNKAEAYSGELEGVPFTGTQYSANGKTSVNCGYVGGDSIPAFQFMEKQNDTIKSLLEFYFNGTDFCVNGVIKGGNTVSKALATKDDIDSNLIKIKTVKYKWTRPEITEQYVGVYGVALDKRVTLENIIGHKKFIFLAANLYDFSGLQSIVDIRVDMYNKLSFLSNVSQTPPYIEVVISYIDLS